MRSEKIADIITFVLFLIALYILFSMTGAFDPIDSHHCERLIAQQDSPGFYITELSAEVCREQGYEDFVNSVTVK